MDGTEPTTNARPTRADYEQLQTDALDGIDHIDTSLAYIADSLQLHPAIDDDHRIRIGGQLLDERANLVRAVQVIRALTGLST